MKKTMWAFFFMTMCSAFLISVSAQSRISDRIDLGREGGTTRGANIGGSQGAQSATPVVEAYNSQEVVTISVENYRGSALVEIIGPREVRQSYIEVYDMGFDVVNLSGLRAGQYTIRITLGSEVYTGTFKIATYGR